MTEVERQLADLLVKYSSMLQALIRKEITRDYHDCWDAYQDICLHLWKYIPRKFNPGRGRLSVYFFASVINTVRHYKKRRRRVFFTPPIYSEQFTDRLLGIIPETDRALMDYLMVKAGTPIKRRVLTMCLYGYTPVEIAKALKISRSCVYNYFTFFRRLIQEYRDVHF